MRMALRVRYSFFSSAVPRTRRAERSRSETLTPVCGSGTTCATSAASVSIECEPPTLKRPRELPSVFT